MATGTQSPASAFRRGVRAETQKKGGKGGKGNWYERMRLEKDVITPVIFIAGEYVDPNPPQELVEVDPVTGRPKPVVQPFFKFKSHKRALPNGQFRDEVCSIGDDPHHPQPCVGHTYMDMGDKSMGIQDKYATGFLHLGYYHGHPQANKDGTLVKKQNSQEYYMVDDECGGRNCNFCRSIQGQPAVLAQGETFPNYPPGSITTFFGHRRYMELGRGHLQNLLDWDKTINSTCFGTAYARDPNTKQYILGQNGQPVPTGTCGVKLTMQQYVCQTCNSILIDLATSTMSDVQIEDAVSKPLPCQTCRTYVSAMGIVGCNNCGAPSQFDLFSGLVLWVTRSGEGTNSQLMLKAPPGQQLPFETLESFFSRNPVDPRAFQGKSGPDYIDDLLKPYNFPELIKPRDLAAQAKRYEVQWPVAGMPNQNYGGAPGVYGQQQTPPPYAQPMQPVGGQRPAQSQMAFVPTGAAGVQPPVQTQTGFAAYPPAQPQQPGFAPYPPTQQPPQPAGPPTFAPPPGGWAPPR